MNKGLILASFLGVPSIALAAYQETLNPYTGTYDFVGIDPNVPITSATIKSLTVSTLTVTGLVIGSFGKVKQVKMCSTKTAFLTTSTSFQSSNLACSITPTLATSSIAVVSDFSSYLLNAAGDLTQTASFTLDRSGTNIGDATSGLGIIRFNDPAGSFNIESEFLASLSILDFPNTTSSVTYTLQAKKVSGAAAVQISRDAATQVMLLTEYGP